MAEIQTNSTADHMDCILTGTIGVDVYNEFHKTESIILEKVDRKEIDVNGCFAFKLLVVNDFCCTCTFDNFLQIDFNRYTCIRRQDHNFCFNYSRQQFENVQPVHANYNKGDCFSSSNAVSMIKHGICDCLLKQDNFEEAIQRDCVHTEKYSLLHLACAFGRVSLVEGLIARGADVNMRSGYLGASPLYIAALGATPNKLHIMSMLLKAGSKVSMLDRHDCNVLHMVIRMKELAKNVDVCHEFVDCFKLLMAHSPDFKPCLYQDGAPVGMTRSFPLYRMLHMFYKFYLFAREENESLVTADVHDILADLSNKGFLDRILDVQNELKKTLLDCAVETSSALTMKILLQSLKPGEIHREEVSAALMKAIEERHMGLLPVFMQFGASVNQTSKVEFIYHNYRGAAIEERMTPLWHASACGKLPIVKMLVEAGAEVNMASSGINGDFYPLITSLQQDDTDVAEYLLQQGAKPEQPNHAFKHNALHAAAKSGHTELVKRFLKMGVSFDEPDASGCTPLLYAIEQQHLEIVEILLEHGASNFNVQNHFGCTPLHYACFHGLNEWTDQLIKRGADVNVQDNSGCSPFWYAIMNEYCTEVGPLILNHYNPCLTISGVGYDLSEDDITVDESEEPSQMYPSSRTIFQIALDMEDEDDDNRISKKLVMLGCPYNCDIYDSEHEDFESWLADFKCRPRSLSDSCRVSLRKHLPSGIKFPQALESLKLPNIISKFIKAEGDITE